MSNNPCQVHIILPPLDQIKKVIDRMKSISNDVVFSANLSGEMHLRVESDAANVETEWRDLRHPELGTLVASVDKLDELIGRRSHGFSSVGAAARTRSDDLPQGLARHP